MKPVLRHMLGPITMPENPGPGSSWVRLPVLQLGENSPDRKGGGCGVPCVIVNIYTLLILTATLLSQLYYHFHLPYEEAKTV